jgi:hypothetical protein
MKSKSRESEFIFERKSNKIRFHVLMDVRFRSGAKLKPITWHANNRFLVHEGGDGGEFFAYRCTQRFNEDEARDYLQGRGYLNFLADGSIDGLQRVLRFEHPCETSFCTHLLERITIDDFRLVEHYKGFEVLASDGTSLGNLESYFPG